jgi:hypothetical protein
MLIILFDIKGIVHKEFVLAGKTVPRATVPFYGYCVKMCEDFVQDFYDKRIGCCYITTRHRLILPFSPGNFFTKDNMTVVPHQPYVSPFSRLKIKLKGRHFDTIEVIEAESHVVLNTLIEHDCQDAFKKWHKHWKRCIHARERTTSRVIVASRPKVSF